MLPGVDPRFTLAVSVVFGWIWGSFLNAAIDRTPPRKPFPLPPAAHPPLPPDPPAAMQDPPAGTRERAAPVLAYFDSTVPMPKRPA